MNRKHKRHMTPYSRAVMLAVLMYVSALPTGYYGYEVINREEVGAREEVVMMDDRYHRVKQVTDGDTLVLESGKIVRIIGIDAPELGDCMGEESRRALEGLVADKEMYLLKDERATDRYERLLRYVFIKNVGSDRGDLNVGKEMVRLGYAAQVQVSPNIQYQPVLRSAQAEARRSEMGIWGSCDTAFWEEATLDTEAPNEQCVIKGNISAQDVKRYFVPNCRSYSQIKIDTRDGEEWFCSESDAVAAGFEKSGDCFD